MDRTLEILIREHLDNYVKRKQKRGGSKFVQAKMFGENDMFFIPQDYDFHLEDETPPNDIYKIAVALRLKHTTTKDECIWFTYWFYCKNGFPNQKKRKNKWQFGGQTSLLLPIKKMGQFMDKVRVKWSL